MILFIFLLVKCWDLKKKSFNGSFLIDLKTRHAFVDSIINNIVSYKFYLIVYDSDYFVFKLSILQIDLQLVPLFLVELHLILVCSLYHVTLF